MGEEKCAPEDIRCQADNLRVLREFRDAIDNPQFRESHPGLAELAPQIDQAIQDEHSSFIQNIGRCVLPETEEPVKEESSE